MNPFPTAVAEFKMSRQTFPERKSMIEFMIKHDPSKDCRIELYKYFYLELIEFMMKHDSSKDSRIQFIKTFYLELNKTVRQVVCNIFCV